MADGGRKITATLAIQKAKVGIQGSIFGVVAGPFDAVLNVIAVVPLVPGEVM